MSGYYKISEEYAIEVEREIWQKEQEREKVKSFYYEVHVSNLTQHVWAVYGGMVDADETIKNDTCRMEKRLDDTLSLLTPEQLEKVVYNAHSTVSRQLADWWEKRLSQRAKT